MTISSSRIAPDVRSTHREWLAAYDLEKGFSDWESRRGTATRIARLTRREQQVVNLLLEGCDNVEIAKQLTIAHRTVWPRTAGRQHLSGRMRNIEIARQLGIAHR